MGQFDRSTMDISNHGRSTQLNAHSKSGYWRSSSLYACWKKVFLMGYINGYGPAQRCDSTLTTRSIMSRMKAGLNYFWATAKILTFWWCPIVCGWYFGWFWPCLRLKLGCFRGFLGHCHGFNWAQLLLLARANLGIAPSPENKWNSSMGQSLFLLPYFGGTNIGSPAMSAMFGYRVPRFWLIAIYIIYKWSCRESLDYIPND